MTAADKEEVAQLVADAVGASMKPVIETLTSMAEAMKVLAEQVSQSDSKAAAAGLVAEQAIQLTRKHAATS